MSVAMAPEYRGAWDYGNHRASVMQVLFSLF